MFNLPSFLTKRDAWAATFDDLFLTTPRTDCPETLPDAPKVLTAEALEVEAAASLNELQENFISGLAKLNGVAEPDISKQGDVSEFLQEQMRLYLSEE